MLCHAACRTAAPRSALRSAHLYRRLFGRARHMQAMGSLVQMMGMEGKLGQVVGSAQLPTVS